MTHSHPPGLYPRPPSPPIGNQTGVPAYASWSKRLGAWLIDYVIMAAPLIVGGCIGLLTGILANSTTTTTGTTSMTATGLSIAGVLALTVSVLTSWALAIYNRSTLGGRTGQTWGRKALNIRLVGEISGQPVGAGNAFLRDLCHILDGLPCYIGYLLPLWDVKRQTLADKVMRTVVVEA